LEADRQRALEAERAEQQRQHDEKNKNLQEEETKKRLAQKQLQSEEEIRRQQVTKHDNQVTSSNSALVSDVVPVVTHTSATAPPQPVTSLSLPIAKHASPKSMQVSMTTSHTTVPNLSGCQSTSDGLHAACRLGDLQTVREILSKFPELYNITDIATKHCTVLQSACLGGNLELIKALSPSAEDILLCDDDGHTSVHYAIRNKHKSTLGVLRYLAFISENSVDIIRTVEDSNNSILIRSRPILPNFQQRTIHKKVTSVIEGMAPGAVVQQGWLSKQGESKAWRRRWVVLTTHSLMYFHNKDDQIPRDSLSFANNDVVVERSAAKVTAIDIFISNQTTHKQRDRISLMASSEEEMLVWLTLIKAATCVEMPSIRPKVGKIRPLITADPDVRRKLFSHVNYKQESLLHSLCMENISTVDTKKMNDNDILELICWLVNNGCDINTFDINGKTPLHFAVLNNNFELANVLVLEGADPTANQYDRHGSKCCMDLIDSMTFKSMIQNSRNRYQLREGMFKCVQSRLKGFHYLSLGILHSTVSNSG
jgi:ankyrin repeat protein